MPTPKSKNPDVIESPNRPFGQSMPWRERAFHTLPIASEISGVSVASLYRFADEGRLTFKRLAGRTLVETASLINLVDSAEVWVASTRAEKARGVRSERARAAWQE
jgi:hypothetical protein